MQLACKQSGSECTCTEFFWVIDANWWNIKTVWFLTVKSTFFSDIYHTTFDWPPNAEIQTRLEETPGYTEEDMVNKLIEYHRHIDEIEECYRKVIKKVNADQPKADVFSQGNINKQNWEEF